MLQQDGWVHVATKGSHWQFTHPTKAGRGHNTASEQRHPARNGSVDLSAGGME